MRDGVTHDDEAAAARAQITHFRELCIQTHTHTRGRARHAQALLPVTQPRGPVECVAWHVGPPDDEQLCANARAATI